MNELNELMQNLPNFGLITQNMKTAALQASRIPDSAGRWPATAGYVDTFDIYYAALSLLPFLAAQPVVTAASSEGTSVTATAPNWGALSLSYKNLSPILSATSKAVLNVVPIPDTPHVRRVPMNDGGGYYGDVDTDIG